MNKESENFFFEDKTKTGQVNEKPDSLISDSEAFKQSVKLISKLDLLVESGRATVEHKIGQNNEIEMIIVKDEQTGEVLFTENLKVLKQIEEEDRKLYTESVN